MTDLSFDVYKEMIDKEYLPSETTYAILVEGVAHENEIELAGDLLNHLYLKVFVTNNTLQYHMEF
ncbi:hypothetical protein ZOSMA_120G00680 [Zostera marina]|uniref:Pentatricopeptide repeat-containing protein n=1 Tax=Zostera marina TaxID=29655 RepID=A0A0K9Q0Y1_ZOSMR|nr:hypothetical protein ZOSMA_120G00680 [Zostera marina]